MLDVPDPAWQGAPGQFGPHGPHGPYPPGGPMMMNEFEEDENSDYQLRARLFMGCFAVFLVGVVALVWFLSTNDWDKEEHTTEGARTSDASNG